MYLFIAICVILLILFIFWLPKRQALKAKRKKGFKKTDEWEAENEFRKTLIQMVGGLVLIVGIVFSWSQFRQTQDNLVTSQIATRFNEAIKLLSEKKRTSRIGAIYALEQIAKESHPTYLQTVLDILTAFVKDFDKFKYKDRESHPHSLQTVCDILAFLFKDYDSFKNKEIKKPKTKTYIEIKEMLDTIDKKKIGIEQKDKEKTQIYENIEIFLEVEIALKVIGRVRNRSLGPDEATDEKEKPTIFKFPGVWDASKEFSRIIKKAFGMVEAPRGKDVPFKTINQYKIDLKDANLIKAILWSADLRGAYLWDADLRAARLGNADLEKAHLMGANLESAFLKGANLRGADLRRAILNGAIGLTVDQLSEAKCLWKVKGLPLSLEAELQKKKPRLFKKECENP